MIRSRVCPTAFCFGKRFWLDLKAAKGRLWQERGYVHYEHMTEEEITDSPHTVIFPNVTISVPSDNLIFFLTEPHADDPNEGTFDRWCITFPVEGLGCGRVRHGRAAADAGGGDGMARL